MGNVLISHVVPPLSISEGLPRLADFAAGSVLKIEENGSPVDYIVAQQGRPSTLYDVSCDGAWLLRKEVLPETMPFGENSNDYTASYVGLYLNVEFLAVYSASLQNRIKEAVLPCAVGPGGSALVASGADGVPHKVFPLSSYEASGSGFYEDGAPLQNVGIAGREWWTRSVPNDDYNVYTIDQYGNLAQAGYDNAYIYVRPCIILPSTVRVAEDGTIIA